MTHFHLNSLEVIGKSLFYLAGILTCFQPVFSPTMIKPPTTQYLNLCLFSLLRNSQALLLCGHKTENKFIKVTSCRVRLSGFSPSENNCLMHNGLSNKIKYINDSQFCVC